MNDIIFEDGFEALWDTEESHLCLVFPAGGNPYEAIVGNIFTPPGWMTWFYHEEGEYAQLEVRDAWARDNDYRVRSGEKAILLFTFGRKHDAGFLRQVEVEPGDVLRLTAWAHAWSNHKDDIEDFPHPDDPRWSEGAGYDVVAWETGTLPQTGDPQTDAKANFAFSVGIDPMGGTNPFADTVVWSDRRSIYNGYCYEMAVEATAEAGTVTVFLRSVTLWPFKHNDAYWDDVTLERIGETEPEPGRGAPREQYARTYNVIPASATEDEAVAVFLEGWRKARQTAGGSYDDAGIGDLDKRQANLYGIPQGERQEYVDFYEQYYPGVEVAFKVIPGDNGGNGDEPEPDSVYTPVSLHIQVMREGCEAYIRAVQPRFAVVFSLQDVLLVKEWFPDCLVFFRQHVAGYDEWYNNPDYVQAGREWIDLFRDSMVATAQELQARYPDDPRKARFGVMAYNELYPGHDAPDIIEHVVNMDIGFIHALAETGLNVAAGVLMAAVGCPNPKQYPLLIPLAAEIEEHDAVATYHGYWLGNPDYGGPDHLWEHLGGRYQAMDDVIREAGYHITWACGESGVVGGESGDWGVCLNPNSGWLDPDECYGGDLDRMLADTARVMELDEAWNWEHGDRFLGRVYFTTGADYTGWKWFQWQKAEMEAVRQLLGR